MCKRRWRQRGVGESRESVRRRSWWESKCFPHSPRGKLRLRRRGRQRGKIDPALSAGLKMGVKLTIAKERIACNDDCSTKDRL